jgi:hypothetical protein
MDTKNRSAHGTPARRAFLAAFEQRPDVVRTREECDYGDKKTVVVFNKNLYVVCSSFGSSAELTAASQD